MKAEKRYLPLVLFIVENFGVLMCICNVFHIYLVVTKVDGWKF